MVIGFITLQRGLKTNILVSVMVLVSSVWSRSQFQRFGHDLD